MNARRILIVGGDSLVGGELARRLSAAGHEVIATTRRRGEAGAGRPLFDLTAAADAVPALPAADAVVLAAAVARLGDCESDPAGTRRINVDGTLAVARAMAGRGAQVVFLSSDKVFDGRVPHRRRDDPVCPLTEYGRQKAAGEAGVLALGPGHAVLRLSKVLAPQLALIAGWLADLGAGRPVTPFSDLYLAPVMPALIAEVVGAIVAERAGGLFHCTGAEDRSYLALARALAVHLGASETLLQPTMAAVAGIAAPARVVNTTLEMRREQAAWGLCAPAFDSVVAALCRDFAG